MAYHHAAHPHPHETAITPSSHYSTLSHAIFTPADSPVALPIFSHRWANDTRVYRPGPGPWKNEDEAIARLPKQDCFTDPDVQRKAAQLQTAVILTMGILSALTTGWWGAVGDRVGRTKVMALSLAGYLFTDVMFVIVARYAKLLAPFGGHKFLLLGPVIEGLLGGWSTVTAAVNAYISDVTKHGSRSKTFSSMQGFLFVGVAAGPAFGSLLLQWTSPDTNTASHSPPGRTPDVLIVFFVSVCISVLNCLYAIFVIPESLTEEIRVERENKRILEQEAHAAAHPHPPVHGVTGLLGSLRWRVAELFEPAALFLPQGRDWKLTYLGIAYFMGVLTAGTYPLKLLYAEHRFGWSAVELGNYLTLIGTVRALHLLIIMPVIIKAFKPVHVYREAPSGNPDATTSNITPTSGSAPNPNSQTTHLSPQVLKDVRFDLRLARASIFIDAMSFILVVCTIDASAFVVVTLLSAFGGGTTPVIQSIALCLLPNAKEQAGKLFGAFSMMSAIGAFILSPLLFGMLYSATVGTFPSAIFAAGGTILVIGCVALLLVRAPKPPRRQRPPRGRSQTRKVLIGSLTEDDDMA
ncbi:hypothetical protein FRB99_000557 [Tulasnella sp. 403]|nr:hypothetical protein FRB99_000557 [Tulasnella sp. 403]